MTKRTFHYVTECGWFFMALFPLIIYLALICNSSVTDYPTFKEFFFNNFEFLLVPNFISDAITSILGPGGVLPLLNNSCIVYLTYYIVIEIAHLLVDVLLFIPRLAHGWMSAFSKKLGE